MSRYRRQEIRAGTAGEFSGELAHWKLRCVDQNAPLAAANKEITDLRTRLAELESQIKPPSGKMPWSDTSPTRGASDLLMVEIEGFSLSSSKPNVFNGFELLLDHREYQPRVLKSSSSAAFGPLVTTIENRPDLVTPR